MDAEVVKSLSISELKEFDEKIENANTIEEVKEVLYQIVSRMFHNTVNVESHL